MMNINTNIFRIIIKLIGRLSGEEVDRLLGKSDSDELRKWYFENRILVK